MRFLVGWDEEQAIVQLYQKLYANLDRIPAGASRLLLKPRRIDDVPILALTFHGGGLDGYSLRRIAAEVDEVVKRIRDVSETTLIGGERRQVRVEPDASLLTAYGQDPSHVLKILRVANRQERAGSSPLGEQETLVETGGFLRDAAEVPPGPPVLQTLVAEVYGPDYAEQIAIAREIERLFEEIPGVVDVDSHIEADQPLLRFRFDQEKAARNGISAAQVVEIAEKGASAGLLHVDAEREDVLIRVRLPIGQRAQSGEQRPIPVCVGERCVPLGEVTRIEADVGEKSICHKNQLPVVYVTGDVAGAEESPVYAILKLNYVLPIRA